MKLTRLNVLFLSLLLLTGLFPQTAYAAPPWPSDVSISAEGGIVIDADTGAVLYGKNIHSYYYPASITKILTALVVIEQCDLDDVITYSHNAVYNVEEGSSNAGIDEGDQLTVRDSLYAMLLSSANEAANALAEHAAGSTEAFAELMNEKAASLGCVNSHFNNPSGLNDPNHYTTAYDMALIAQAAFANDTFVEIDSSLYHDMPGTKRNPDGFRIYPGHKMLKKSLPQYYPGIIGGKTGYTSLAGNTLVTCAQRDGMKLISVILNGHQTHYTDTKTLLDFGFENFQSVPAAQYDTRYSKVENDMTIAGLPTTDLSVLALQEDRLVTLPKSAAFSDADSSISYDLPVSAPENAVACITYSYNERTIGSVYLMRTEAQPETLDPLAALPDEDAGGGSSDGNFSGDGSDRDGAQGSGAADGGSDDDGADGDGAADGGADDDGAAGGGSSGGGFFGGSSDDGDNSAGGGSIGDGSIGGSDSPQNPRSGTDPAAGRESAFSVPAPVWIVLGILAVLALAGGGLIALKLHIEKKEEAERLARYQRRQKRLQDIGMSTADFDLLMQQKRTASRPAPRRNVPRRRKKGSS